MNKVKTADPNKTRAGKTSIKGFQKNYLLKLIEETSKPKEKAKLRKRLNQLETRISHV